MPMAQVPLVNDKKVHVINNDKMFFASWSLQVLCLENDKMIVLHNGHFIIWVECHGFSIGIDIISMALCSTSLEYYGMCN